MSVFDWKGKPSEIKFGRVTNKAPRQGISHLNPSSLSVDQLDMEGNYVKRFPSFTSAARCLEIPRDRVADCVNGKIDSYKGFKFLLSKFDRVQTKYEPNKFNHRG